MRSFNCVRKEFVVGLKASPSPPNPPHFSLGVFVLLNGPRRMAAEEHCGHLRLRVRYL